MRKAPASNTKGRSGGSADAKGKYAFTLIELLVCLAVVLVLLALLFPTLTRAKKTASEAVCLSNLRQLFTGFQLYLSHNSERYPAGVVWSNRFQRVWNPKECIGGPDGLDTNCLPSKLRPLFPYLGGSKAFACPADIGYDFTTPAGFLIKPSLAAVAGTSYLYNAGNLLNDDPLKTDGLGGKAVEWVKRPDHYALVYEPPAEPPGQYEHHRLCIYWHRARVPGSVTNWADQERGPRVSPFLFVDGHAVFRDCSYNYALFPDGVDGGPGVPQ